MSTQTPQLLSQSHWVADGSQTVWNFSFTGGYINVTHVRAYKRSPAGVRTDLTINYDTDFVGPYQLLISPAVEAGYTLVIYRDSSNGGVPLVDFFDGSNINEKNLDVTAKQSVFVSAETEDFLGVTTETDLMTLGQAAAASAGAAEASAITAANEADAASAANVSAQASAVTASGHAADSAASAAASAAAATTVVNTYAAKVANPANAAEGDALIGQKRTATGAVASTLHDWHEKRVFHVAADFGVSSASSAVSVKAALQLAISAAGALSRGGVVIVEPYLNYGYKVTDKTTHPSFSGINVPVVVMDYSEGASYAGYPDAYDGAQVRYHFHTPQTTNLFTFTAPLSGGATSGTLSVSWAGTTGTREVRFSNGDIRYVLFTNSSTATSWTGGLSGSASASARYVAGNHDGNGQWLHGAWHPYICINSTANVSSGPRTALDNYRASLFVGADGVTGGRFGQGTAFGETLTKEELTNLVIEMFALPGDTVGTNWSPWIAVRKTQRVSYGSGTNAPLANHHFAPGNPADTSNVALFQSFSATSTISLQSTSGPSARSIIQNNAGVTEIGAQTGGSSIGIRQADSFNCFGTGTFDFTYHNNLIGTRANNWVTQISNNSATNGFVLRLNSASAAGTGFDHLAAYSAAVNVFRVIGNGDVRNTNNSYGAISDIRYKREIEDSNVASIYSDFSKYRICTYKLWSDILGPRQLGAIAQEMLEVSPGLVDKLVEYREVTKTRKVLRTHSSGYRDADGKEIVTEYEEDEEYIDREPTGEFSYGIKYSILYLRNVVVTQELQRKVKSLKDEVSMLKKQQADILARLEAMEAK